MFLAHALECGDRTRANTLSILRAARTDGARKDSVCLLCGSCAMLFVGRESPNYCSACGAPYYALREVK
jgi:rubrerythrin